MAILSTIFFARHLGRMVSVYSEITTFELAKKLNQTNSDGNMENIKVEIQQSMWLVGYSFGSNNSQFDRFIKESIWEGYFNDGATSDQKQLILAKTIKKGDVLILKSTSTKGPKHDQPFMRVKAIAVAAEDIVLAKTEKSTKCRCAVSYVSVKDVDFDGSAFGAYRKTIHQMDKKLPALILYVKQILGEDGMNEDKYQPYIDLLKSNKNLVLTGAPGTGKTFMAQEIAKIVAKEDSEAMKFVQFHPSYDYTDFVEGLRPIDDGMGQISFKRKDGVFKKFCRKAAQNLIDSAKSAETLGKEFSWQEKLQQFVGDAIDNNTKFNLTNGNEFTIVGMNGHAIKINNEQNEKTTNVLVNADEVLDLLMNEVPLSMVLDIRKRYGRKFGTQADSYEYVIVKEIRNIGSHMPLVSADVVRKKDFIFVIDEINRGEASKIFGELFYAIDPGYRGKKDVRVQTQYQNLVPSTDLFANGFYVPENVYILATMNDIDRSVESMDFAMRRRFTWKEIVPADTQGMLDVLDAAVAAEAKAKMARLNEAIAKTDGLGAAYMIGPSYFLKLSEHNGDFVKLWNLNIEPLLKEYLRGFRRADEALKKFRAAYTNETTVVETETADIIDEN